MHPPWPLRPRMVYVRSPAGLVRASRRRYGQAVELLATRQTDAVSTVLDRINVRSVVYCLSELSAPWGFQVDASPAAKFHLVLGGQATLSAGGGTAVLTAGEL